MSTTSSAQFVKKTEIEMWREKREGKARKEVKEED